MKGEFEMDEVVSISHIAYNFFSNGQKHESAFLPMFRSARFLTLKFGESLLSS